ncbi:uncharacterized protein K452DRAFT_326802 [Aplosporella prunicola CBS 121167]|uniref:SAM and PH domain-containing protein n=1 Tax=Aplosporella prunicola CBS 121167 TaxID=1176127 RepID=A0A6A6BGQ3_9PEZI|nr:uncharacterized protein K452DRAFT_326802 [Aplosporella prunicola CBS 121167]KAF2141721.1 hypothetical protein K452DRAFT_326802 [Aplosporella prunicola CBS 121167]
MATFRPMSPLEAGVQMYQSGNMEPFLTVRSDKPRPLSEATEIFDTDFEDDDGDDSSDFEEESVPKYSFESNDSRKSQTTISTYEEVPTPHSSRRMHFDFQAQERRSIEGPKGPHLFRSSLSSAEFNYEYALQMSPLLPKQPPPRIDTAFRTEEVEPMPSALAFEFYAQNEPEPPQGRSSNISSWTAQQVADWMYELGFEDSIIEKFEHHDITGAVLLDMQFEDLKELDIPSFGKRHQLWNHIDELRGNDGRISPQPTPFQDTSRPCTRNTRSNSTRERSHSRPRRRDCEDAEDGSMTPIEPGAGRRRRGRRHRSNGDDIITPAESVSIVAIEQLLPKPHHCSKGERCHKWRKQQRQLQRLQEEHGFPISPDNGGHIFIAGDPGNAAAATNLVENVYRPTSDALPSVVASSDLMGPGQMPAVALQEDTLRTVESRDPQENVKHFLTLQHMEPPHIQHLPDDRPSSPLEMFPPLHPPHETQTAHANLRNLPKLNIPRSASANVYGNPRPMQTNEYSNAFSPCRTANASPNLYRFGTPASEMDVPLTQVPLGPISRDTSQSVPPGMQYRDPVQRTASSNEWRRPSYVMPSLRENEVYSPPEAHPNSADSATLHDNASTTSQMRKKSTDSSSSADMKAHLLNRYEQQHQYTYDGVNHAGWMKKRRTKLLRHEWQDQHFRLAGTRLAMHASDVPESMALDTINVDEYAVACSSLASNKLAAKLKGLKLANSHKKDGSGNTSLDAAAFTFQLVPTGQHGEDKSIVKKTAANGKTHHFAVKTRDERIDWMRELMLAKAMKAKKEGYEVEINGSAV